MPPKEDILFCKIAITNGFVSEADAQKVLALCDKREQEQGRRPMIGAVFSKYNLMRSQEVQKVYEAIQKRTDSWVGTERALPRKGTGKSSGKISTKGSGRISSVMPAAGVGLKGARPGAGQESGRFARSPKASKGVDPATLWMGIGGIVALVGIVVTILVMVTTHGNSPPPGGVTAAPSGPESIADTPPVKEPAVKPPAAGAAAKPVAKKELSKDYLLDLHNSIADAQKDEDPRRGLERLEKLEKDVVAKGYEVPKQLLEAISQLREREREAGSSEPPAGEANGEAAADPGVAGQATPKGSEAGAKKAEAPAPPAEDPATSEELEELEKDLKKD